MIASSVRAETALEDDCSKTLTCARQRYRRNMDYWGFEWCSFRNKLHLLANDQPLSGRIGTALGISAVQVLRSDFPAALQAFITGYAFGGGGSFSAGVALVSLCIGYVELYMHARALGDEMVEYGTSRVKHAVFHRESSDLFGKKNRHRGVVVLWILRMAWDEEPITEAVDSPASPRVAELGVFNGEMSEILLAGHALLRWVGVDCYNWTDAISTTMPFENARQEALDIIGPYANRARLIESKTDSVKESDLGDELFDLVFVDADHSEAGVLLDLSIWYPRVRPGGVIAGHDYASIGYPGVAKAVHAFLPQETTLHLGPQGTYWWRVPKVPV